MIRALRNSKSDKLLVTPVKTEVQSYALDPCFRRNDREIIASNLFSPFLV